MLHALASHRSCILCVQPLVGNSLTPDLSDIDDAFALEGEAGDDLLNTLRVAQDNKTASQYMSLQDRSSDGFVETVELTKSSADSGMLCIWVWLFKIRRFKCQRFSPAFLLLRSIRIQSVEVETSDMEAISLRLWGRIVSVNYGSTMHFRLFHGVVLLASCPQAALGPRF